MKRYLILIVCCSLGFTSCSKKIEDSGSIELTNGKDERVKVTYRIPSEDVEHISKKYTFEQFYKLAEEVSSRSKIACNHMATYSPKDLSIIQSGDTSTFMMTFYAKNSYGVEDSEILFYDVIDGKILSFESSMETDTIPY
jgi:hypothetical protein